MSHHGTFYRTRSDAIHHTKQKLHNKQSSPWHHTNREYWLCPRPRLLSIATRLVAGCVPAVSRFSAVSHSDPSGRRLCHSCADYVPAVPAASRLCHDCVGYVPAVPAVSRLGHGTPSRQSPTVPHAKIVQSWSRAPIVVVGETNNTTH